MEKNVNLEAPLHLLASCKRYDEQISAVMEDSA